MAVVGHSRVAERADARAHADGFGHDVRPNPVTRPTCFSVSGFRIRCRNLTTTPPPDDPGAKIGQKT